MDLSKLPDKGADLNFTNRNFGIRERLWELTRNGRYQMLRHNMDAIVRELEKHEELIRRGGLDYEVTKRICYEVRQVDKNLTDRDMVRLKEILGYFSK